VAFCQTLFRNQIIQGQIDKFWEKIEIYRKGMPIEMQNIFDLWHGLKMISNSNTLRIL
jgi:predicted LPLAT superfamily acyltransferase